MIYIAAVQVEAVAQFIETFGDDQPPYLDGGFPLYDDGYLQACEDLGNAIRKL